MGRWVLLLLCCFLFGCDAGINREAKDAVRQGMLDPDATQFRDVETCSGDSKVIRGEVNGKNSFGAYVGFKSFYYSEYRVAYAGDAEFMTLMDRCYNDLHKETPLVASSQSAPASAAAVPTESEQANQAPVEKTVRTDVDEPEAGLSNAKGEEVGEERCWMDYCPCERGPDFGGADGMICNRLKAGLPVDDELMSGASGMRDARRQLREFEGKNGSFD